MLGEDHHDFIFELFADDHVSNGGGDEIFVEFLLIFFSGEVFLEILHFVGQPDPAISIEDIWEILKFVVVGDLVDSFEFGLHGFVVERVFLQMLENILPVPLRE